MADSGKPKAGGGQRQGPSDPAAGPAGRIAHDLSNLLLVIGHSAEYLKDELPANDPRQEHVAALLDAAERARELTVRLQALGDSASVLPKPDQSVPSAIDYTGNEVILVVEDDAAVRSTVRHALERVGYSVYEASNGAEALHVTQLFNAMPDLLLADLVMPEVSGHELVESLARQGQLPKVLLMSGYTDGEVGRRTSPSKTYPFIKKPFTLRELAAKVRETLDAPA